MVHVSNRASTTRSQQRVVLLHSTAPHTSSAHNYFMLLLGVFYCCCIAALLPATYAKGYLDVSGGGGGGGKAGGAADLADTHMGKSALGSDETSSSTTSAEILQLPHAFRHQQHYAHRIEQAVNDFKRAQLQQQQMLKERDKNSTTTTTMSNKNLRHQQIQAAQQQPQQQQQQQHHRRHEQHVQHRQQQLLQQQQQHQKQLQLRQHQLRHHNHHHAAWEQRAFPALRHHHNQQPHQLHRNAAPLYTTTTESAADDGIVIATTAGNELAAQSDVASYKAAKRAFAWNETLEASSTQRYFDRDSIINPRGNSLAWTHTTRGPKLRHSFGKPLVGGRKESVARQLNERAFGDEGKAAVLREGDEDLDLNLQTVEETEKSATSGGHRISLKLDANDEDDNENDYDVDADIFGGKADDVKQKKDIADAGETDDEDGDDDDDDDDDYEYEDDDDDSVESEEARNDKQSRTHSNDFPSFGTDAKAAVKRFTNPFKAFKQPLEIDRGGNNGNTDADNSNDEDLTNENENDESVGEGDFSNEKWNKIEHEHHLKQQQHQHELLALRAKHGGIGIASSSSSSGSGSNNNQLPARRHSNNDDDMSNIFSRYYIPGTLTRQKQAELGTPEAVQESRRTHAIKHKQNKALANAHVKQIISEAACRVPQRRIERIQRDASKIYTPHCTVLYRCADDTGCCRSERQTCAPKRTKSVDLYFFVKSINDKKGAIERLTFVNHTECHCVDRSRQRPEEYGSAPSGLYGGFASQGAGGQQILRRATILNCNCPKLYEKILQEDGYCRCDCSSGNTGCDWLKRGMEHFSMNDRKCILEGRCKPPTCQYGNFIKKHGRCPRREEQLSAALGAPSPGLTTNSLETTSYH